MRPSPLFLLAFAASGAQADTALPPPGHTADMHTNDAQQETPPPLPEAYQDEIIEGEGGESVRIERRKAVTIETYRLNGQITKIRIIPDKGRPYYLIDHDGDGSFDIQRNELDNPPLNQWPLFEW